MWKGDANILYYDFEIIIYGLAGSPGDSGCLKLKTFAVAYKMQHCFDFQLFAKVQKTEGEKCMKYICVFAHYQRQN